MCKCWNLDASKRPTFEGIIAELSSLIHPEVHEALQVKNDEDKLKYAHLTGENNSYDNHEYLTVFNASMV